MMRPPAVFSSAGLGWISTRSDNGLTFIVLLIFIKLNPDIKCTRPPYEFCEYLDKEHKENNILIRHNEAVECMGKESERIKFKIIPTTKVLSIFYKGAYDEIGVAYSFLMKYVEDNGYQVSGRSRECYIDGIWNKESVDEWLTEIQIPIV